MGKQVTAKVTLVRYTPEPEQVLCAAAKLCYASETEGLLEQDKESAGKFIAMLKNLGHLSPIEHVSFTYYLEGVSRALTHQLVRHRIASFSQRSQRYVAHENFEYICPPQFEGKTVEVDGERIDAVEYFAKTMELIAQRYKTLNEALGSKGEKSNEDARYVLPNACETKIFVTMNARQLLHFFSERCCMRAQWEIRGVAAEMLRLAKEVLPSIFNGAGPKCVTTGICPEGKMSCGLAAEMKKIYGA